MTDLTRTRDAVDGERTTAPEPIAIVGIGCRFPGGGNDPGAFWELLTNGVDAVCEVPPDRWSLDTYYDPDPKSRGTMYSRWGGFLDQVDRFDAQFFKIAPREAALMDPQQRLLLEVSWEALEDGGYDVDRLSGTDTGVFVGISTHDYSDIQTKDTRTADPYTNTGGAMSIAANRLSYSFDFHGPSFVVDTACSSSLVAVHLACQSLRARECHLALAGGVNCMLTPEATLGFSRAMMLSPSGRCHTFDAEADGYVRGEGAGVIVLKPLSNAMAAGDRIYATIVSSGVNQDGRSHGLTVPSADAQEALLREVYGQAGVEPDRLLYFEAHGTGTAVGDPLEAAAIGAALGKGRRPGNPLRIGSVKTNIGHLEAGAGMAGLIKSALLITHRQIPPTLHFRTPNPKIPLDDLGLRVQQALEAVPDSETASVVGVNSFGFGGTNAHVALDRAPAPGRRTDGSASHARSTYLVPLSARSTDALQAAAASLRARVTGPVPVALADLCYTAGVRRTHHDHRLAVIASSPGELALQLEGFSLGEGRPGLISGRRAAGRRPTLAFVFSGMGPQWWAMGRQLLAEEPVFRRALDECDELFRATAGWSLLEQMTVDADQSRMEEAGVGQPANFALQVGLATLWRSWGVVPDAIVGHSAGEVAAAWAAGILSLDDAVTVIFHRSRLQQRATSKGRMLAAGLPAGKAPALMSGFKGKVSLAAINSPRSVTFTGDEDALEQIAGALRDMQVFSRMLDGRVPYHSHHMDPLEQELVASLLAIAPRPATVPFYSTVTGDRADGREVDATYWWGNVRQPVAFAPAVERILAEGIDAFLELGPHPVMGRAIVEIQADRKDGSVPVLGSLRRETPEREALLATTGTLYTLGCAVDWTGVNGDGALIPLPTYPWQRERCWSESERSASSRLPGLVHPLLQRRLESANPTFEAHLEGHRLAYLRDHVIQDAVVFPGAAYIETALAVNRELTGEQVCVLEELRFKRALILREEDQPRMQFVVHPNDGTFAIHSCLQPGQAWALNGTGRFGRDTGGSPATTSSLGEIQARCRERCSGERSYEALTAMGFQYGPTFRGVDQIWQGQGEALGRIRCPEELLGDGNGGHIFHPALLDACFQIVPFAALQQPGRRGTSDTIMPVEVTRFRYSGAVPGSGLWCHVKLSNETRTSLRGDFAIFDEDGTMILEITGFKGQKVPNARAARREELDGYLHELRWCARTLPTSTVRQAEYMPDVAAIAAGLVSPAVLERHGRRHYFEAVEPRLDRLCAAYAWEALGALGWAPRSGDVVGLASLAAQCGVLPAQQPYLSRLVQMLEQDRVLRRVGAEWLVEDASHVESSATIRKALAGEYAAFEDVLVVLERCGTALADVLKGAREQDHVLFPDGPDDDMFRVHGESPSAVFYGGLVRESLGAAVARLPKGRTIRVLEVGGGVGGTTAQVLSALPRHRTEYVFTDASDARVAAARQRFAEHPFVEFARLDIGGDVEGQGFAPHSFDLVIAVDALEAAGDARRALTNIGTLLSSDGLLVALEATRDNRVLDLLYGPLWSGRQMDPTDPKPWRHRRPAADWTALLAERGFAAPAAISDGGSTWDGAESVLLARGPHIETDAPGGAREAASAGGTWVVFADQGGVADRLAAEIDARGGAVVRVSSGEAFARLSDREFEARPGSAGDLETLVRSMADILPDCRGLVHLWGLGADDLEGSGKGALEGVRDVGCASVLHLVQALGRAEVVAPPRLWIVTRGSQRVGEETRPTEPSQALLWGLGRVVMNEQPQLRATLVDLDPDAPSEACARLVDELSAGDVEQEVAWRGESRQVVRLVRASVTASADARAQGRTSAEPASFLLEAARPGALESLRLREVPRRAPGRGEVEIDIRVAGINFRDVMKAMGMYLEHLGEALCFGDECAGTIARVGEGVTGFAVGDEVIGMAPGGAFARYLTLPVEGVVLKPAHLSFEQAATLPMVFMTTHYALNHVARIKKGERILIHSAAGGVGLAAIQIARNAGAEIFATAGSPEKRALLSSMGIEHVMDSRSLAFADEIPAATGGRGLDIVLNSLAGEFLVRSLALLRPTGRFVELGKVDFFENTKLGLSPFKRGLSFLGVDLGFLLVHEPGLCRQVFLEVARMFEEGTLQPLPVTTFPASSAAAAFRYIIQARHIGKVALTIPDSEDAVVRVAQKESLFREDATYLVTGGLRGFGLATATWMVEQGARHLVLAGRSGASTPEADAGIARMRERGATVVIAQADVSHEDEVVRLVADIERSMPPLRGVFHAATVIDDGFLLQLDAARFATVLAAKAHGAWHLHRHTRDTPLDYFVLFSSISSVLGSPGQANYAAANAFLDALAHHRRGLGLPALAVNWSAISDVGYFARHPEIAGELQRQGISAISPSEAMSMLGTLLESTASHVAAIRLDREHLGMVRSSEAIARRLALVVGRAARDAGSGGGAGARTPLLTTLAASRPEARPQLVEAALRADLARLLGVRESRIDPEQPLNELGIDSLMSVELETAIRVALGIDLPLGFLVSDNVTLKHLSLRLATQSQAAVDLINANSSAGSGQPAPEVAVMATAAL